MPRQDESQRIEKTIRVLQELLASGKISPLGRRQLEHLLHCLASDMKK